MGYVVKVEAKNGEVRFADRKGSGSKNANDAQIFYSYLQATEVRDTIQKCVGDKAHAYLVVLP